MTFADKAQRYNSLTVKLFLFALLLLGGISSSTKAQEIVKGTFTLNSETRFDNTLLPAGRYTVSVEPITSMTSSGTRVLVFVRPETKSGPVVSVLAMASQETCETPSGLTLASDGTGFAVRSLCLSKQGINIDFDLSHTVETPKVKAAAASAQQ
jgi:hypothetical protein